jgi:START domain-containing protein
MSSIRSRGNAVVFALLLTLVAWLAPSAARAAAGAWERIRSEDGILVYKKDVPGSSFVAFRGEGDVDGDLLRVGSVIVDVPREKEWLDSVVEARILRRVSDSEYIMYSHLGTPVPLSDRDFVNDVTIQVDPASQTVTFRMRSVDDPAAPKTSYVRASLIDSSFTISPAADGKKTHVVAEIHCDPKGAIPSFVVNMFQRGWGYNTIQNLRRQVAKSQVATHPLLKAALEGSVSTR